MPDFVENLAAHRRDTHGIGRFSELLREIVYGGNDGIVTTFAIVAGFAGAAAEGTAGVGTVAVLLFGLANLFADATSMALGAYLSSQSERDLYAAHRGRELDEIATQPENEHAEAVALLTDRGMSREDADALGRIYLRNPEIMADFMMQYELDIRDPRAEGARMEALATFASFVVFGVIPLLPYLLGLEAGIALPVSVGASLFALGLLGLLRWKVTREGLVRSIAETVLVGVVCGAIAFAVGLAFR